MTLIVIIIAITILLIAYKKEIKKLFTNKIIAQEIVTIERIEFGGNNDMYIKFSNGFCLKVYILIDSTWSCAQEGDKAKKITYSLTGVEYTPQIE